MTSIIRPRIAPVLPAAVALSVAATVLFAGIGETAAQQMGKTPYDSPRSNSLPAQFQFQKKFGGGSSGGMGALTQYVTNYNSSSTSIGNYTEVIQTLGDGAQGSVTQSATQDSSGTQEAVSDAHDNQTTNNNVDVSGKGKGPRNAIVGAQGE